MRGNPACSNSLRGQPFYVVDVAWYEVLSYLAFALPGQAFPQKPPLEFLQLLAPFPSAANVAYFTLRFAVVGSVTLATQRPALFRYTEPLFLLCDMT